MISFILCFSPQLKKQTNSKNLSGASGCKVVLPHARVAHILFILLVALLSVVLDMC